MRFSDFILREGNSRKSLSVGSLLKDALLRPILKRDFFFLSFFSRGIVLLGRFEGPLFIGLFSCLIFNGDVKVV